MELSTFLFCRPIPTAERRGRNLSRTSSEHLEASRLLQVSQDGRVSQVESLLINNRTNQQGANIMFNIIDHPDGINGRTPLMLAVIYSDSVETVQCLLRHGANIEHQDKIGMTALSCATSNGLLGMVQLLLYHRANVNHQDTLDRTPLCEAIFKGHMRICQLLLEGGANIEQYGIHGRTPLGLACWSGHVEIVRLLLDNNANIDHRGAPNTNGMTPLSLTTSLGHLEVVRLLLDRGANVHLHDRKTGYTPLIMACKNVTGRNKWNIRTEMTRLLLQRGANVEYKDNYGRTALWYAIADNNHETLHLLLRHAMLRGYVSLIKQHMIMLSSSHSNPTKDK